MSERLIRVLLVEDVQTVALLLKEILESDPRIQVADVVESGEDALARLDTLHVDLVLMDIHLPGMNGFETTRQIMQTAPVPIVICSATADPHDLAITFEAMEAGALAVFAKPASPVHPDFEQMRDHLLATVRAMSEVKLVRRRPHRPPAPRSTMPVPRTTSAQVVVIGASTGGPPVLRTILSALPRDLPVPVLVVQHIAAGFLGGLVDWLSQEAALPTRIARSCEKLLPGHVYFAPDGHHLRIHPSGCATLRRGAPHELLCPSVAQLFQSAMEVYHGAVVAVLLTGMGRDGAAELATLHNCGAITIAQDKETSVVHGMPGEAIRLGAASMILPAHEIAPQIRKIFRVP